MNGWSENMRDEIALTIKPLMSCNMRCRHCFNGDDLNISNILPVETACRFLEIARKDYDKIKVTFHGGEPTLASIDFYKTFYALEHEMHEHGATFYNFFTTNGYKLSEELAYLLISNNAMINVSFDGPYNHVLRTHTETVYRNIMMLQEKGARLRIFCTVCEESYRHLEEIYEWFRARELDFKILPIEPRGYAAENKQLIMNPEEFTSELVSVYRLWAKDIASRIKVYTFQEFANLKAGIQFTPYWFNYEIALNPDGKIYPFGRPHDVNFCLGTPEETDHITECFTRSEYLRMLAIIDTYRNSQADFCGQCPSSHICRGTSLCSSFVYGDNRESLKYSCRLSDNIFRKVLRANAEMLADIEAGNSRQYNTYILSHLAEHSA